MRLVTDKNCRELDVGKQFRIVPFRPDSDRSERSGRAALPRVVFGELQSPKLERHINSSAGFQPTDSDAEVFP